MKYVIDKNNTVPAYLQLYMQVRDDIVNKIYQYNTKIPSKRVVAEELGISTVTVEHAYQLLNDEGYIEARQRSGYFVIFRTNDGFLTPTSRVSTNNKSNYNHVGLDTAFPFGVLTKTMRGVISDFGEAILERPDNSGCIELREAIRCYLARSRGIVADVEQIIIGSGSEYLYTLILELLGKERIYAIESPSYKKIEEVYRAAHIEYEALPLNEDGIESSALNTTNSDVLHISPYRSFPSGVTASASKRHEYLRWASKEERYIIEDDFESEFSVSKKSEDTLFSLSVDDNVIYMNTFSRTISDSFRVGYMVLPKKLVERFNEYLGFYSCTVPTYIQLIIAQLISSGDFERHINRVRRRKRKELNIDKTSSISK